MLCLSGDAGQNTGALWVTPPEKRQTQPQLQSQVCVCAAIQGKACFEPPASSYLADPDEPALGCVAPLEEGVSRLPRALAARPV